MCMSWSGYTHSACPREQHKLGLGIHVYIGINHIIRDKTFALKKKGGRGVYSGVDGADSECWYMNNGGRRPCGRR